MTEPKLAEHYNESYKQENFFRYPEWLYAPWISGLVAVSGLKKGQTVLDVGCGQGFFSYLLSTHGLRVHGIDISEAGIRQAERLYGRPQVSFSVADVQTTTFSEPFDCIFVRSCSLYNTDLFASNGHVTRAFLRHLKPTGTFIFAYNTKFTSKPSHTWRYHSIADVRQHFSGYRTAEIFFLNRITPLLARRYSFSRLLTKANVLLSKVSGIGGDIVCVVKAP
jgi:SAM-dependent methyltransferase